MKKNLQVKIVTCHDVYNFGASLQAFALQTYLERMGHEVCIIDYKPPYQIPRRQRLFPLDRSVNVLALMKMIYHLPRRISHIGRNRKFREFTDKYLHLTDEYNTKEQVYSAHLDADVFICGSDQIWNSMYPTGWDSVFYLDFVTNGARKVAYAPSISITQMQEWQINVYKRYLPSFDFVSIREKSSIPFLNEIGRNDVEYVCDPVMLFPPSVWDNLLPCPRLVKEPYLLLYDFDGSKENASIAKEISKAEGLRIINISIDTLSGVGTKIKDIGPIEFVSFIRHASFVVSSSFHGTIFSLLYHKRFCVVRRQLEINLRMQDLLDTYNLTDRFVSAYTPSLLHDIDYQQVDNKMNEIIGRSKDYLARALHFENA